MRPSERCYFLLFFSAGVRLRFYKKLALMLNYGISLFTSLRHLYRLAEEHKSPQRYALRYLLTKFACGNTFGQCLEGLSGAHELLLIESFEKDNLAKGLSEAKLLLEQKRELFQTVLRSLAYPVFLLILACGLIVLIGHLLVPAFLELVPSNEWQGFARFLLFLGNVSQGTGALVLLLALALLTLLLPFSLPRLTGRLRRRLDAIFPWNCYRLLVGANWLLSFSALLAQGIQARTILLSTLASSHTSPYLRERIFAIESGLAKGKNLGEAFAESGYVFPSREIVEDMRLFGSLPGLEGEMQSLARASLQDTQAQIAALLRRLSMFLLIVVAVLLICVLQGLSALELSLTAL